VFRPLRGTLLLLGAVGQLQFEVAAHRLKHEYNVEARVLASPYTCARWVTADDPAELNRFVNGNEGRLAYDAADSLTLLTASRNEMKVVQEMWPKIKFHTQREHAGLSLESMPA
jgi:peptide chain release factor 3